MLQTLLYTGVTLQAGNREGCAQQIGMNSVEADKGSAYI